MLVTVKDEAVDAGAQRPVALRLHRSGILPPGVAATDVNASAATIGRPSVCAIESASNALNSVLNP